MADVHLAANRFSVADYQEDTFDAFEEALTALLAERPDVIVVAGDLFDKPSPPNMAVVRAVRLFRRAVESGVRLVFAVGEHDQPARRDSPSVLVVAEALGGARAGAYAPLPVGGQSALEVMESMRVKVPGRGGIVVLPFVRDAPEARKRKTADLLEAAGRLASRMEGARVLVAHIGLRGHTIEDDAVASPQDLPGSFDYAALGHVHASAVEPPGEGRPAYAYPGTLVPVSASEVPSDPAAWRPGPLLVDLSAGEPSVERLVIEPPRSHVRVEAKLSSVESVVAEVRRALRGVQPRKRKTLVHLTLWIPGGGPTAAARDIVAAVEERLGVVARIVRISRARDSVLKAASRAPTGSSEVEVVESIVGDRELAGLIVELKDAILRGDDGLVTRLLDEILSPRFERAWARLLPGGQGAGLQAWPEAPRRATEPRGLRGWIR